MPPALLLPSDDSDAEEVDGAVSRREKRTDRRCKQVRIKDTFLLLLITVCLFFAYLSYNQYILKKKFNELNETLADLILLPSRLRVVEEDIHRLRMEFDLTRDQEITNNSRATVSYVYDTLTRLQAELADTKTIISRTHNQMEDVTRRVSIVESRCLAVCQIFDDPSQKQRRRQAEKKQTHEIIFKRGGQ